MRLIGARASSNVEHGLGGPETSMNERSDTVIGSALHFIALTDPLVVGIACRRAACHTLTVATSVRRQKCCATADLKSDECFDGLRRSTSLSTRRWRESTTLTSTSAATAGVFRFWFDLPTTDARGKLTAHGYIFLCVPRRTFASSMGLSASLSQTTPTMISVSHSAFARVKDSPKKTGPRSAAPKAPSPAHTA